MAQGLTPGPLLFVNHGPVIYAHYAILLVTNVALILFGLVAIRGFSGSSMRIRTVTSLSAKAEILTGLSSCINTRRQG